MRHSSATDGAHSTDRLTCGHLYLRPHRRCRVAIESDPLHDRPTDVLSGPADPTQDRCGVFRQPTMRRLNEHPRTLIVFIVVAAMTLVGLLALRGGLQYSRSAGQIAGTNWALLDVRGSEVEVGNVSAMTTATPSNSCSPQEREARRLANLRESWARMPTATGRFCTSSGSSVAASIRAQWPSSCVSTRFPTTDGVSSSLQDQRAAASRH